MILCDYVVQNYFSEQTQFIKFNGDIIACREMMEIKEIGGIRGIGGKVP
jgi:hypothetical protein